MMTDFNDDLSAFRRFIEEMLNLDGLEEAPHRLPPGYAPLLRDPADVTRDVRATWHQLRRHDSGTTYWRELLTDFEQRVRSVLQQEILLVLRHKYAEHLPEQDLRSIIAYSMTVGWIVLGTLSAQYAAEDATIDDDVDPADLF